MLKGKSRVRSASDGTNDNCSSLKSSSELASGSSKSGGNEATDCDSSDAEVSETYTDGSSSPFRKCKHCDKPATVENMLICDECEEAYHTSCCVVVRMKEIAEIDDWLTASCSKKKSSNTNAVILLLLVNPESEYMHDLNKAKKPRSAVNCRWRYLRKVAKVT